MRIYFACFALYVAAVVGVFVWKFGARPLEGSDPAVWGQFGDYIGGMLNPAFSLVNVLVVIYLAIEVQRLSEAQREHKQASAQQIQTAVDLHREWNSESIYRSRTSASKLVREFPGHSYFEIEDVVADEQASHIWVVVSFFQRLEFLARHGKLDSDMVRELFGELFVWWWIVSFSTQLDRCDCDARLQMIRLKNWFLELTTEQQRMPWLERADRDLQQARENAGLPLLVPTM